MFPYFGSLCPFLFCNYLHGEERESWLIFFSLSSWCLVIVVWLFLSVPWVCLQFVIVIFSHHTHYFWVSSMRAAMALVSLHNCLVYSEPS